MCSSLNRPVPGCLRRLRREHGIAGGIPVLLSTERPRCQLVSLVDMEGGNPLDYQVCACVCCLYRRAGFVEVSGWLLCMR